MIYKVIPYFTYFCEISSIDVGMVDCSCALPFSVATCELLGYLLEVRILLKIFKLCALSSFSELE